MKKYDLLDLENPETYKNDAELASFCRKVVRHEIRVNNVNRKYGEFKKTIFEGRESLLVAKYLTNGIPEKNIIFPCFGDYHQNRITYVLRDTGLYTVKLFNKTSNRITNPERRRYFGAPSQPASCIPASVFTDVKKENLTDLLLQLSEKHQCVICGGEQK